MLRIEHREDKWEFPFVEYVPENGGEKLPLIIQLHGAGERGEGKEDLKKVDVNGFSKYLKTANHNVRVIMPQCSTNSFWAARVESLIRFTERLIEEYKADKKKVYLTGMSMGGFGTWFTALARPDLFAAIAPCCGGGMAWAAGRLKDVPIKTFHGALDDLVNPFYTEDMVNALKACGADITYTRVENVGHNVWDYTYDRELMEWLLEKENNRAAN